MKHLLTRLAALLSGSDETRPAPRARLGFESLETRWAPAVFRCVPLASEPYTECVQVAYSDDVLVGAGVGSTGGHV